jgi:iron complex outermembrane recepter protein
MKQFLLLLTAFFSLNVVSNAQNQGGKIQGHVVDGSQKTIESATVSLHKAKDSSVIKYAVADKSGNFSFEQVADGQYFVSVSAVGHARATSETILVDPAHAAIILKTLELVPQPKALAGVTVSAKRAMIEQKIDRTVLNVEASITNAGATALEVLEKAPGVSVDKDGNISLKGKEGVMILVDGRPTQLGSADLANMLRSMNASQLDQVEIMTNPPAKYDAAGNAGIINIKTKKSKVFGYNGALTLGYTQGWDPKFNENFNFNYRAGKLNFFSNLSHNYRIRGQRLDIQRNFMDPDSKEKLSSFDQEARMMGTFQSFSGKVGMDYFANKNTTYGIVFNGFTNPSDFTNTNHTDIYNPIGYLRSKTDASSTQLRTFRNFSTNFNFRSVLDSTGKEITADVDYVTYGSTNNTNLSNYYTDAAGNPTQKSDTLYGKLPQNIDIYSGRVDYLHPLKNGARFEAGIKSSYVRTDNNAVYDTLFNGELMHDYSKTNKFNYEENINAVYTNISGALSKKINYQLGLRMENTNLQGHSAGYKYISSSNSFLPSDTSFTNSYTQVFPTAFLQYKANEKNNFGLNFGRRIRRPNYEHLNPFIEYLDRYTYMQGNPLLKPQFSNNIELSHSYKNFLTTTVNYSATNNIIQQVLQQNEATQETYMKRANLAKQRQAGLSVNTNIPVTKWWTSNVYTNVNFSRFEGVINNADVMIEAVAFMANATQQFKFGPKSSAEISGFYRSAGIEGVIKAKSMGMLAFGFSQQIMKNNGTLRLNVRDILQSQKFRGEAKYGTVDARFQESSDSRTVSLGFTYRFNKGKVGGVKRRAASSNDEQSRVGGSN